jgi:hypothetical protein
MTSSRPADPLQVFFGWRTIYLSKAACFISIKGKVTYANVFFNLCTNDNPSPPSPPPTKSPPCQRQPPIFPASP